MSPTLDETATVRDARLAEHGKRQTFLRGLATAQAYGLPAPTTIDLDANGWATLRMDDSATADVDDWAAFLSAETSTRTTVFDEGTAHAWQVYETPTRVDWRGYEVRIWCVAPVEPVTP